MSSGRPSVLDYLPPELGFLEPERADARDPAAQAPDVFRGFRHGEREREVVGVSRVVAAEVGCEAMQA